jgi:exodeoxyribonuclease VII small subunit
MKGQGKRLIRGCAREEMQKREVKGCGPRIKRWQLYPRGFPMPTAQPRIESLQNAITMTQAPSQTPASYEAALQELEQLVGLIESGQLPLEELLTGYQRGAQLLQFCRDKLQAVENQIKVLDEGTLKPWTQE